MQAKDNEKEQDQTDAKMIDATDDSQPSSLPFPIEELREMSTSLVNNLDKGRFEKEPFDRLINFLEILSARILSDDNSELPKEISDFIYERLITDFTNSAVKVRLGKTAGTDYIANAMRALRDLLKVSLL